MKRVIVVTIALLTYAGACCQRSLTLPEALASVEANNPELKALRHEAEAAKAGGRAQSSMPDPEVSFGYLWSGRKDVSVSQGLDWATISGRRRAVSAAIDSLSESTYAVGRQDVLLRARLAYTGVVKSSLLVSLHTLRLDNATRLADMARRLLAAGGGRQSDAMVAALARAQALAELTRAQSELDTRMSELAALNGGEAIMAADTALTALGSLPGDFDSWYASVEVRVSPLALARARRGLASAEADVARAEAMPQVSLGYMGEFTPDESYQGVTLGVSLPLWSARRRARQSHLEAVSAQSRLEAEECRLRSTMRAAFNKTLMLGRVAAELRESLQLNDGRALAAAALSAGEMTAAEAIYAESLYYEAAVATVNAEAEYLMAIAELESCVIEL